MSSSFHTFRKQTLILHYIIHFSTTEVNSIIAGEKSHPRMSFPRKLKKCPVNFSKYQTTSEMSQSKETSHCEIPLSPSLRNWTLLTGFLHNCKHAKRNSNNTDSIPFKPSFRTEHSNISETFCRRSVFISSFQKKDLIRLQTIWFLLSQRIKDTTQIVI